MIWEERPKLIHELFVRGNKLTVFSFCEGNVYTVVNAFPDLGSDGECPG
jgi:hypothetical protein